jgi:hypothetical protein
MTDPQRWYLEFIVAQHINNDDQTQITTFIDEKTHQDLSVPGVAKVIDFLRRTIPETAKPTPKLLRELVRVARKGNLNDRCKAEHDLITKLEREYDVEWNTMTAYDAMRIFDACRAKANLVRGDRHRFNRR